MKRLIRSTYAGEFVATKAGFGVVCGGSDSSPSVFPNCSVSSAPDVTTPVTGAEICGYGVITMSPVMIGELLVAT